jgi:hypothetical protein
MYAQKMSLQNLEDKSPFKPQLPVSEMMSIIEAVAQEREALKSSRPLYLNLMEIQSIP